MPPSNPPKTSSSGYPRHRPPAAKPRRSTGMIAVIAVAAVAVLAVVVAVITQLGSGGSDGAKQTQPVIVDGTSLPQFSDAVADPADAVVPPTLEGKSFDGTPVTIDPGDGKPKLVMFVAHWCPHCQAEVPRIVEWQKAGLIPAGVEVYAVATGTSSTRPNYPPSKWLEREGWTIPTLADAPDSVAAEAWGLTSYPYFVAVGADGKVVKRSSGELTQQDFVDLVGSIAPQ